VTLPDYADAGFVAPSVDLTRIEVQVEDQQPVESWNEVLESWQVNRLFSEAYKSPEGRVSRGVLSIE
jgi:hypothetical protein